MTTTLVTAGTLGLMLLGLSAYVIAGRVKFKIDLGEGESEDMRRRIRVHANFVEYVPLALVLLGLVDHHRIGPGWLAPAMGAALVAGRVLHALGLAQTSGVSFGRFVGTNLTFLTLLVGSVAVIARGLGG